MAHITPVTCHAVNFSDGGLIGRFVLKGFTLEQIEYFFTLGEVQLNHSATSGISGHIDQEVRCQRIIIIYLNRFFTAADILQAEDDAGFDAIGDHIFVNADGGIQA